MPCLSGTFLPERLPGFLTTGCPGPPASGVLGAVSTVWYFMVSLHVDTRFGQINES